MTWFSVRDKGQMQSSSSLRNEPEAEIAAIGISASDNSETVVTPITHRYLIHLGHQTLSKMNRLTVVGLPSHSLYGENGNALQINRMDTLVACVYADTLLL